MELTESHKELSILDMVEFLWDQRSGKGRVCRNNTLTNTLIQSSEINLDNKAISHNIHISQQAWFKHSPQVLCGLYATVRLLIDIECGPYTHTAVGSLQEGPTILPGLPPGLHCTCTYSVPSQSDSSPTVLHNQIHLLLTARLVGLCRQK